MPTFRYLYTKNLENISGWNALGRSINSELFPLASAHSSLDFHKSSQHSQVTLLPVKYGQGKGGGAVTDKKYLRQGIGNQSCQPNHPVPQNTLKIMESILRKHVDNVIVVFVLCIDYSQICDKLY